MSGRNRRTRKTHIVLASNQSAVCGQGVRGWKRRDLCHQDQVTCGACKPQFPRFASSLRQQMSMISAMAERIALDMDEAIINEAMK